MTLSRSINKATSKVKYVRSLFERLLILLDKKNQTYFPEHPQKNKLTILADQLKWIFQNKELSHYYYVYGQDRKTPEPTIEIMPYRRFTTIRDKANLNPAGTKFNYACVLRDKFLFGQFLKSLNVPTPKNLALIDTSGITWLSDMHRTPLDAIKDMEIDGFCKKLLGIQGEGAFPLKVAAGKIYSRDSELSIEGLRKQITALYLLQDRIKQHHTLSQLHPSSINTMRIITFNQGGEIEVFGAVLRMGANGSSVDNWNAGGISISIDINTGRLRGWGMYKPGYGGKVEVHPDSGITLPGFELPLFHESVALVSQVHRYLYGIHSIGWDVALTEEGPVVIEGNEDWGGGFTMRAVDNFRSRFLHLHERRRKKLSGLQ